MKFTPELRQELHNILVGAGFVHTHYDADWEDVGNGETGPMLRGGPAYDEYESDTWRYIVDADGIQMSEERDLAFEAWIDSQAETGE